jgi:hypothetical protein
MNKKLLLCLLTLAHSSYTYTNAYNIDYTQNQTEDVVTTLEQDLETLYTDNAITKDTIDTLLQKHDVYNIDELLYFLNKDRSQLSAQVSSLRTARYLSPFLVGGIGLLLATGALNIFLNSEKNIQKLIDAWKEEQTLLVDQQLAEQKTTAYKTFNVNEGISSEDLTRKRNRLMLLYHTDKNNSPDAKEKSQAINDAYALLTGQERNRKLDTINERAEENKSHYEKQTKQTMWSFSALSTVLLSTLPFIITGNNKALTEKTTQLEKINNIIDQLEIIQNEEEDDY